MRVSLRRGGNVGEPFNRRCNAAERPIAAGAALPDSRRRTESPGGGETVFQVAEQPRLHVFGAGRQPVPGDAAGSAGLLDSRRQHHPSGGLCHGAGEHHLVQRDGNLEPSRTRRPNAWKPLPAAVQRRGLRREPGRYGDLFGDLLRLFGLQHPAGGLSRVQAGQRGALSGVYCGKGYGCRRHSAAPVLWSHHAMDGFQGCGAVYQKERPRRGHCFEERGRPAILLRPRRRRGSWDSVDTYGWRNRPSL